MTEFSLPAELCEAKNTTLFLDLGWSLKAFDYCWLDCDQPGFRKRIGQFEICLCLNHAAYLENGARLGSPYAEVEVPKTSEATRWPWQLIGERSA